MLCMKRRQLGILQANFKAHSKHLLETNSALQLAYRSAHAFGRKAFSRLAEVQIFLICSALAEVHDTLACVLQTTFN